MIDAAGVLHQRAPWPRACVVHDVLVGSAGDLRGEGRRPLAEGDERILRRRQQPGRNCEGVACQGKQ